MKNAKELMLEYTAFSFKDPKTAAEEVSQRVIHACGILYFVESSLKVWVLACSRSDRHVKLSLV